VGDADSFLDAMRGRESEADARDAATDQREIELEDRESAWSRSARSRQYGPSVSPIVMMR